MLSNPGGISTKIIIFLIKNKNKKRFSVVINIYDLYIFSIHSTLKDTVNFGPTNTHVQSLSVVLFFVLAFLYNETSFESKGEYVTVAAQVSRTIELYWREIRFGLQLMTNYGATAPNDPCDVLLNGSMTNKQISHLVCQCYRLSQLSFFSLLLRLTCFPREFW